jgi:hypothetical protein
MDTIVQTAKKSSNYLKNKGKALSAYALRRHVLIPIDDQGKAQIKALRIQAARLDAWRKSDSDFSRNGDQGGDCRD